MYENFSAPSTESLDSIFNKLQKIVSQLAILEVKGTASSSSSSQNMAFMSSPSSTNEVNIVYEVSTGNTQVSPASTQVSTASTQVSTANLSDDTKVIIKKTGRKITNNGSDTAGYDKSKLECFNCHKIGYFIRECRGPRNPNSRKRNQDSSRRTINVEETYSKEMVAIDGVEKFQQPKFEGYGPKSSKSVSKDISNEVRESTDASLVEEFVSDDKSQSPRGNQRNWNNQKSQKLGSDFVMYNKACFVCESFDHVQADCNYHKKERVVSRNNYTRVNYNYSGKKAHPSALRNMVPRAVLMKTDLRSLNTIRPVNTARPKTTVYSARRMSHFYKSGQSTIKRPYQIRTTLTNKNFSQKVNTAKGKFYTARPKVVNTARPNSAVVNAMRANQGLPQKEDQGYVDSGCSRNMTWNMSYLSGFKEFDGGYVTFRGGAKGGKITGKGTLKTGKLDFEDVYFIKELQFNIFSVS
ncbi:ribonuclease H-like domain-containing protein [Tanacetum coccineum]